jgi:hypothetical protein
MTDLSPAAQAVLDAFGTYPLRADHIDEDLVPALAAALRAAADQVVPDKPRALRGSQRLSARDAKHVRSIPRHRRRAGGAQHHRS